MKLTILTDNNAKIDSYLLAEPALSFYIQLEERKILFDCGYSDVFMQNAYKLGINLRDLDNIVLSHGHNDHTGGLYHLKKLFQDSHDLGVGFKIPKIIAHKNVFEPMFDADIGDIGCPVSKEQLRNLFHLELSQAPLWLDSKTVFLGEIPKSPTGCVKDSALVHKSSKGLIVVVGCSHSGLKNIIEFSKIVTGEDKICAIIGGFHLLSVDKTSLHDLINYLKTQNIETLYPTHCCDLNAKIALSKELNLKEVFCGSIIDI